MREWDETGGAPKIDSADPHVQALRLLARRMGSGEAPGHFSDGLKIGGVFNGGGMSNAIQAAELTAIHDMAILAHELRANGGDLKAATDVLTSYQDDPAKARASGIGALKTLDFAKGSSAGAFTMLYAANGNPYWGELIYQHELTQRSPDGKPLFMDIGKGVGNAVQTLSGVDIGFPHRGMNMDLLSGAVRGKNHPEQALDANGLLKNVTMPMNISVMQLDGPMRTYISQFASGEDLIDRATDSCRILGIAKNADSGSPQFYDAALSSSVPLDGPDVAKADLVLDFGAAPVDKGIEKNIGQRAAGNIIGRFSWVGLQDRDAAGALIRRGRTLGQKNKALFDQMQKEGRLVYFGAPPGDPSVPSTCMDERQLAGAAKRTYAYTMDMAVRALKDEGLVKMNGDAMPSSPALWDLPQLYPNDWAERVGKPGFRLPSDDAKVEAAKQRAAVVREAHSDTLTMPVHGRPGRGMAAPYDKAAPSAEAANPGSPADNAPKVEEKKESQATPKTPTGPSFAPSF